MNRSRLHAHDVIVCQQYLTYEISPTSLDIFDIHEKTMCELFMFKPCQQLPPLYIHF